MNNADFIKQIKKSPRLYLILISIFYFFRFFYFSVKEKSTLFLRYYPGHYSSTIPSKRKLDSKQNIIFDTSIDTIESVELNESFQLDLLDSFSDFYPDFSFPEHAGDKTRYYYDNPMFGFNDGFTLYSFICHFKPERIIEAGSGFSSALMLDISDTSPEFDMDLTFIEPYPARLIDVIGNKDRKNSTIIEKNVQDISLELFDSLKENDILFIDSSHTMAVDSDLSKIIFSILPVLNSGVLVQFHDIFWPLEYPRVIFDDGRVWNEAYFLRAFLQFNDVFEIVYFGSYLEHKHTTVMADKIPGYVKGTGSSLWLRKRLDRS